MIGNKRKKDFRSLQFLDSLHIIFLLHMLNGSRFTGLISASDIVFKLILAVYVTWNKMAVL